jgi:hypothetical protein
MTQIKTAPNIIDWETFDWETFEAYIAHFQEKTLPSNYHDVGTSLEIALELASGGQLERMLVDTYYDLFTIDVPMHWKVPMITVQAKKSKSNTVILKNSRNNSKTKIEYADYYAVCNYDTRQLFEITGEEVQRVVEETKKDSDKDVSFSLDKCKKNLIWSGSVWKTLNNSSDSWFQKKNNALYDLWYNCKDNVKQQSPLGKFIE